MDNYFTNIPLFAYLRTLGIEAAGTTQQGSKCFPTEFAKLKASKTPRPIWNTLQGKVINDVLALIWMDNNYVLFLTTIHEVKGVENHILRSRHRPGITSTNTKIVRPIFGGNHTRMLLIPVLINMYNLFMGGVDIADQRWSYWPTQLRVSRNWLPLFFWCLDTAIINAFILYRIVNITSGVLAKNIMSHRQFREKLYQELILESTSSLRHQCTPSAYIITKHRRSMGASLPNSRFQPGKHIKLSYGSDRKKGYCAYCSWLRGRKRVEGTAETYIRPFDTDLGNGRFGRAYHSNTVPGGLGKRPAQTRGFCSLCKVFLCPSSCFDLYHTRE